MDHSFERGVSRESYWCFSYWISSSAINGDG